MNDSALITTGPLAMDSWENMKRMAEEVSNSKMFGIVNPSQAMCLFAICQAEGRNPIDALRRYHLIENKPSIRADAMLADFTKAGGGVLWHVRTDEMVCATWFASVESASDLEARARGARRFEILWELTAEKDAQKRGAFMFELAKLARDGEETILRTYADCEAKGLTIGKNNETKANWLSSPRQMLTARCLTEGIRIVMPGLAAGIPEEQEVRQILDQERSPSADPDIQSMTQIMEEHERNAGEAKSPQQRQHFQGLASEMRCKIADLNPQKTEPTRSIDATEATVELPNVLRGTNEEDQIPGIEEPPKPTEEATEAVQTPPDPPEPATDPVALQDWRNYALVHTKSHAYKGRKLGSFKASEIEILHEKRCLPFLQAPEKGLREEALYIQAAYNELKKLAES